MGRVPSPLLARQDLRLRRERGEFALRAKGSLANDERLPVEGRLRTRAWKHRRAARWTRGVPSWVLGAVLGAGVALWALTWPDDPRQAQAAVMASGSRQPPALVTVSEQITVSDVPVPRPSARVGVTESIAVTDNATPRPSARVGVAEAVSVNDVATPRGSAQVGVAEGVAVGDSASPRTSARVGVGEAVSATDTAQPRGSTRVSVGEAVAVLDGMVSRSAVAATSSESVAVSDGAVPRPSAQTHVQETVHVSDAPPVIKLLKKLAVPAVSLPALAALALLLVAAQWWVRRRHRTSP